MAFDKLRLIDAYVAHDPPFADREILSLVQAYLVAGEVSAKDLAPLRRATKPLRANEPPSGHQCLTQA